MASHACIPKPLEKQENSGVLLFPGLFIPIPNHGTSPQTHLSTPKIPLEHPTETWEKGCGSNMPLLGNTRAFPACLLQAGSGQRQVGRLVLPDFLEPALAQSHL